MISLADGFVGFEGDFYGALETSFEIVGQLHHLQRPTETLNPDLAGFDGIAFGEELGEDHAFLPHLDAVLLHGVGDAVVAEVIEDGGFLGMNDLGHGWVPFKN